MGKGGLIHILNTITVVLIIVIYFSLLTKGSLNFSNPNDLIFFVSFILVWIVTFLLYIAAFWETKLNNIWFKAAFALNIIDVISFLVAGYLLLKTANLTIIQGAQTIFVLAYVFIIIFAVSAILTIISLVIFSIGFFRNKK